MKIALLGYGKMGKLIESLAINKGHTIELKISSKNINDLTIDNLKKCDTAIEFSTPDNALDNILTCVKSKIPLVVGTTGKWYEQLDLVKEQVKINDTALLYATNFSIGVNIFFAVNNYLAEIMKSYNNYNPEIEEIHHTQKKDSPSGTAITIANGILSRLTNKTKWENITQDDNNKHYFNNDVLPIKSVRKDPAPGTHTVKYISPTDTIEICHEAFNRNGFASGALLASEWLNGKKGIFTMQDILKF